MQSTPPNYCPSCGHAVNHVVLQGAIPLVEFAKIELIDAGLFKPSSDYEGYLGEAVLKLIEKFSGQGHSGTSAALALELFNQLVKRIPLHPCKHINKEELSEGWKSCSHCGTVFTPEGKQVEAAGKIAAFLMKSFFLDECSMA